MYNFIGTFIGILVTLIPAIAQITNVMPTGGAVDELRKQDPLFDIVFWIIGALFLVIGWQEKKRSDDKKAAKDREMELEKKIDALHEEINELRDTRIKQLEDKLRDYERP